MILFIFHLCACFTFAKSDPCSWFAHFVIEYRLVCTALYNDGDGERKYLPQFFKFSVSNPLSVRTKVTSFQILFVHSTFCINLKIIISWFIQQAEWDYKVHINNFSATFSFSGSHHQGRLSLNSKQQL
jgi:hypothetical protein